MSYRPKSTYQVLQSSGDEYFDPYTGKAYVGPYVLTSEGAFQGNSSTRMGPRLHKITPKKDKINNINETVATQEYYSANFPIVEYIKQTKPIIATKTLPTEKDYKYGSYLRYFVKKVNSLVEYYEVDNKTYKLIKAKNRQYDFYSFEAGYIRWALIGNVQKANTSILEQLERKYPNISNLFLNVLEYSREEPLNTKTIPTDPITKINTKLQYRGWHNDAPVLYKPSEATQKELNKLTEEKIILSSNPDSNTSDIPPTGGGGY